MKRIVVLLLVMVIFGAVAPSAALAGIEPSPFHADVNKLEAVTARMEASSAQLERVLAEPTPLSDKAIVRQLEAVTKRVERDIGAVDAIIADVHAHDPDHALPPEVLVPLGEILDLSDYIMRTCASSSTHPVYGEHVVNLLELTQSAHEWLVKFNTFEMEIILAYDVVPYGEPQRVDMWLRDGWGSPVAGSPTMLKYIDLDNYPMWEDWQTTDTNGYLSSTWLPDWVNNTPWPGGGSWMEVSIWSFTDETREHWYAHEYVHFDLGSPPTGVGDGELP